MKASAPGFLSIAAATLLCLLLSNAAYAEYKLHLSEKEASEVGKKIWRNECGGTIEGLTSWNAGEEFPSLGIGHFIWYPEGFNGPFDESFPKMLAFLNHKKANIPKWLSPKLKCPWHSRAEFLKEQKSPSMKELRDLLASTVAMQTEFIIQRLQDALPKMLEEAPTESREKVKEQFERVLSSGSAGAFALIDYVNFKGEGVVATERYKGKGWGMLQVLLEMSESDPPVKSFANAAIKVLTERVKNSPSERNEQRWLAGWTRRVSDYKK